MSARSPRRRAVDRAVAVVLAAAVAAGVSACTSPPPRTDPEVAFLTPEPPATTPDDGGTGFDGPATDAGPTDADVSFVAAMAAHHAQAVELASLAPERVHDAELGELAARIVVTQAAEAAAMREWLDRRRSQDSGDERHDHSGAMAGEIGRPTLDRAAELDGADFDALFLDAMIAHHRGAVTMAESRLSTSGEPAVARWARSIAAAQSLEIERLLDIRDRLGAE